LVSHQAIAQWNTSECLGEKFERKGVLEVRDFNCDEPASCSASIWGPSHLEGRAFKGFTVLLNPQGDDKYDLALSLNEDRVKSEVVGFMYGTLEHLENLVVIADYWQEGKGCPLSAIEQVKHNQSSKKDAQRRASS